MKQKNQGISRRRFLENAAALSAVGTIGVSQLIGSCTPKRMKKELNLPPLLKTAPEGDMLKAGVIGCGGRGPGAAINFLNAGPNLQITALADVFQDRIDKCRADIKEKKGVEIPDAGCFTGFDGYKRLLESGIDIAILATPPYFRPEQFKACIEARKHVFMEKPVAVDPVGARSVMSTAKLAEASGLTVITGTQRRHQHEYIETYKKIMEGTIGELVAANCWWNQVQLWHRSPQPEWTEMEYMIRDWVNWTWLSGDHIVEQHIHNIDVVNWYLDKFPVRAVGVGSRQRRLTGDCYDNFSIDFVYEGEIHMHSMCRQINDCAKNVSEFIRGTNGYTNCKDMIWSPNGTEVWKYQLQVDENGQDIPDISAIDQEHIDLVTCIRNNQPRVEAEVTAKSTLAAIMGRIAAYTGNEVTWEEMMSSELKLGPEEIILGPVDMELIIPKPGSEPLET